MSSRCHQASSDERQEDAHSHNSTTYNSYSGPVTNNYYTVTHAPPTLSCHGNKDGHNTISSPNSCQRLHKEDGSESHDKMEETGSVQERTSLTSLSRKTALKSTTVTDGPEAPPTRSHRSYSDSCVEERRSEVKCRGRGRLLSTKNSPPSSSHSKKEEEEKDELHLLGARLFDVFPYSFIRKNYKGYRKEMVWYFVLILFIYQAMAAALMCICEDGGLRAVFHSGDQNRYPEIVIRFLKFTLKMMFRVVIPLCCTVHLPILATAPKIPKLKLSADKTREALMKIHEKFSSAEEVTTLRGCREIQVLVTKSEEMAKRFIRSTWITIASSFLLVFFLVYLGAFYVCEQNTMKGGMCNFLAATIIKLPFLDINFHFLITTESLTVLLNAIIFGVVGDCYSYENRIATYAVSIGGEAKNLFHEIRQRWVLMDHLVCATPFIMAAILALSITTGRPFLSSPDPVYTIQDSDLADWYFWILVLTAIFFLGTSSDRMMKQACVGCCLIAAGLLFAVHVESSHIPYGSIMVLLYTIISAYFLNLLYSLYRCHHSNAPGGSCSLTFPSLSILLLMALLAVSLTTIICREINHFSLLVSW